MNSRTHAHTYKWKKVNIRKVSKTKSKMDSALNSFLSESCANAELAVQCTLKRVDRTADKKEKLSKINAQEDTRSTYVNCVLLGESQSKRREWMDGRVGRLNCSKIDFMRDLLAV